MSTSHEAYLGRTQPSLRSLEVFVAAAQAGNFTVAGEKLGITQSAVSRQISDLEGLLGVSLFVRRGARLTLTAQGHRLAERLSRALFDARQAVADVAGSELIVTVSMLPSVAAKWLAPRLGQFVSAFPQVDLRVSASRHLVSFSSEGIDAAIRYGLEPSPSLHAVCLARETVTPVVSPEYLKRIGLYSEKDLLNAKLLHGDIIEDWRAWFEAAGLNAKPSLGPQLGDDTAILQAAIEGHGVALGRSRLVVDDLRAGRLIAPFGTKLDAKFAYWFVYPKESRPSAALRSFESWVIEAFKVEP